LPHQEQIHADKHGVYNYQIKRGMGLNYGIGSQNAPYGAPGLRERILGAPRAIRLVIKILKEIYCGAPYIMVNLSWAS